MDCNGIWREEMFRGEASEAMSVHVKKCSGCNDRMVWIDGRFQWQGPSAHQAEAVGNALKVFFSSEIDFVVNGVDIVAKS